MIKFFPAILLIAAVTAQWGLRGTLPKPSWQEALLGENPPSPLFVIPGKPAPKRGETLIQQHVRSEVGQALIDFADPHSPVRPIEVLKQVVYPAQGGTVELHWLNWAAELAPYDIEIKRIQFFWTLQIQGPQAAAETLKSSLGILNDNGLLWLDLSSAILFVRNVPERAEITLEAFKRRNNWTGWSQPDIAKLAARLLEEKRLLESKRNRSETNLRTIAELDEALTITRGKLREITAHLYRET